MFFHSKPCILSNVILWTCLRSYLHKSKKIFFLRMDNQKSHVNKLFHTPSLEIEIFQRYESTLLHTNISESFRSFASGDFGHKIFKVEKYPNSFHNWVRKSRTGIYPLASRLIIFLEISSLLMNMRLLYFAFGLILGLVVKF